MYKVFLLGVACVLAVPAQGQHLLTHRKYHISRIELVRFTARSVPFESPPQYRVNYVMNMDFGGIHIKKASPDAPTKAIGPALCDISQLRYVYHMFEDGQLTEYYKALYKVHAGGTVPHTTTFPNPSSVELYWKVSAEGPYRLDVFWYVGKRDRFGMGNGYRYTLYCEPILD